MSIFKKIFDNEDIIHAGLRDFNNRNYLLPEMCQSLLIVDEDAADLQLDSAATSAIKQFTHGQPMKVRSIYEKTKTLRPRAMVVACTNHMPTAVDKSEGLIVDLVSLHRLRSSSIAIIDVLMNGSMLLDLSEQSNIY